MDCELTGQRFPHGFSFHNQGSESSAKSSLPTISEKLYDDLLYKNLPVDLWSYTSLCSVGCFDEGRGIKKIMY